MHTDETNPATGVVPPALRKVYEENHIVPLWESMPARTFGKRQEEPRIWRWSTMQPIIEETMKLRAQHVLDRRVLHITKPDRRHEWDEAVTGQLTCTYQSVMPGERASVHRHAMNALRFVLQTSEGARSIVNGKPCSMHRGDLVLTPAWTWHEHLNEGPVPVVWIDVLDVGIHDLLGTAEFQPGPVRDTPPMLDDDAFSVGGIIPALDNTDHAERPYSPVFHYSWADAVAGLERARPAADGSRRIRYSNPLTGGPSMDLLDSTLLQFEPGQATRGFRTSASALCIVVEGEGVSDIGGQRIEWAANDVFTMPSRMFASHEAKSGRARLFQVSNRDLYRRLGLLSEEWAN